MRFTLPCDHEVEWICGSEADKRENPSSCDTCIKIKWMTLIETEVSVKRNQELFGKEIWQCIERLLGDSFQIENIAKTAIEKLNDFDVHNQSRQEILNRFLIATDEQIDEPKIQSLAHLSFYELGFIEVSKEFKLISNYFYFEPSNTNYGRGIELTKLNEASLSCCKPDESGFHYILVGAAFRFQVSPFTAPYCAKTNKKSMKNANKLTADQKKKGFDCIQSTPFDSKVNRFLFFLIILLYIYLSVEALQAVSSEFDSRQNRNVMNSNILRLYQIGSDS